MLPCPDPRLACLIVNADDYGYFAGVSRGILEAARAGVVTATGVMANAPDLERHLVAAAEVPTLDLGVHLNLTYGEPLTEALRRRLSRWGGRFPGKFPVVAAILSGRIPLAEVEAEWRAQIGRCAEPGRKIWFLNSHEHVHMLPTLFGLARRLADELGVPHLRYATPEWGLAVGVPALFRNLLLAALALVSARRARGLPLVPFLGLGVSGRLGVDYLREQLPRLRAGQVYELMCHPGHLDQDEVRDPALLAYHRWEEELATLRSPAFAELRQRHGVRLVGYRDLPSADPTGN